MTTPPTVAVIAAGGMGAPTGARLTHNGVRVLTDLAGRSTATVARAEAAGMAAAGPAEIAGADIILSIVPPGEAVALAERLAPAIAAAARKPLYADCNAISPETALLVAGVVERAGAAFVDAGIIGGPPRPEGYCPAYYASGAGAPALAVLNDYGLDVRVLDGPPGAASALKMCYAGLTKGLHALGVSVMLGAMKAGVADELMAQLAESQPEFVAYFTGRTPSIFSKAYRWVAEMEEIGAFLGGPAERIYNGAARVYERLAIDHEGERLEQNAVMELLRGAKGAPSR